MSKPITLTNSDKLVNKILSEINDFETRKIYLSNKAKFSQYNTIQEIKTHQNKGFLTDLAPGQEDEREFYDIISPMIETAVVNTDLDTQNIEAYCEGQDYQAHQYFANSILKTYFRQTYHGIALNDNLYDFIDDGNLIVRRVENEGELYRPILPQNLYVLDQAARTPEDTVVIEKDNMNQSELRVMKKWDNIDKVIDLCNVGESEDIPSYDILYREGELTAKFLGNLKKEIHGIKYRYKTGDNNRYVQCLTIIARAKKKTDETETTSNKQEKNVSGIVVFAEELKPQTIKVTKRLKIKRYKSYESVRLGKFTGRFWGQGYREIGKPFQNRANELGNQLREIMKVASRFVFWSKDEKIAGKNILSSIKNGQIIKASHLAVLNNIFPNLGLYAEEWNRNIKEAEKALKAFEVASGENLPSSATATGIAIQNQAVGRYYNFKRERYGLFLSVVFKRWVLPDLLRGIKPDEAIELIGDPSFLEEIIDAYINGWMATNYLKMVALAGGIVTGEQTEMIKQAKKEELLKRPKLYAKLIKDFFKEVEFYIGINTTGELFNKQITISNIMKLIELEVNPAIYQNPQTMNDLQEIRQMLGLKPIKYNPPQPEPALVENARPKTPSVPQKEPSAQGQELNQ